jgi:putative addiction module component (TIGR02574 family)
MYASAITTECLKLSVTERIQLVEDLWDSVANEAPASVVLTAAQSSELHTRLAAHRGNPESAISWEHVRSNLFTTSH